jgi:hypothetical protein
MNMSLREEAAWPARQLVLEELAPGIRRSSQEREPDAQGAEVERLPRLRHRR